MSSVSGLYLERAVEISSSLTVGCESPLREKAHASGYIDKCTRKLLPRRTLYLFVVPEDEVEEDWE